MTSEQKTAVLAIVYRTTAGNPFIPEDAYLALPPSVRMAVEEIATPYFHVPHMADAAIWVLQHDVGDEGDLRDALGV